MDSESIYSIVERLQSQAGDTTYTREEAKELNRLATIVYDFIAFKQVYDLISKMAVEKAGINNIDGFDKNSIFIPKMNCYVVNSEWLRKNNCHYYEY